MRAIKIGDHKIGDGSKTFIVFEAGPTHTGLESAKKLVDIAVRAGADAIKFQMMDVDRLMGDKNYTFEYKILVDRETGKTETIREPLYNILKRRELKRKEWAELKSYCDRKGIIFFSTACFKDEIDFLVDELEVPSIKINSGDVNYLSLIEYIAKKGINIQLDTGNAEIWEIERAVNIIEDAGNQNIIIHHCPSGYPAYLDSIHLNMIKTLKAMFEYPIGFSDHTPGWVMDVVAIAFGANLIEKTITLNKTTRGCEHMFSLEEKEAIEFIKTIRGVEVALGSSRRRLSKEAREGKLKGRRSAFLVRDLKSGKKIRREDIEFRRPGYGIPPDMEEYIMGRRVKRDLKEGHILQWSDLI
jgi:sialic acid synthase SpsE